MVVRNSIGFTLDRKDLVESVNFPQFFSTLRLHNRKLIYASEHFERLKAGFTKQGLTCPIDWTLILEVILGNDSVSYFDGDQRVRILIDLFKEELEIEIREAPPVGGDLDVHCIDNPFDTNPSWVKSYPYDKRIQHLKSQHTETLIIDEGFVLSGIISNVFIIKANKVLTPKLRRGILDGVIRSQIIDALLRNGVEVLETDIRVDQLKEISGMFFCNSVRGIRTARLLKSVPHDLYFENREPITKFLKEWNQTTYE